MDPIATKSLVTRLSVYVIALVFYTSTSWTAVFAQDIAGGPEKQPVIRKPIGPMLGHIDHAQALLHYQAAKDGRYRMEVVEDQGSNTDWTGALRQSSTARKENDYCVKWRMEHLEPDTAYLYRVVQNKKTIEQGGSFRTPADPNQSAVVSLGFGSCADSKYMKKFHDVWHQVRKSKCEGFVMLGDTPYINSSKLQDIRPRRRQLLRLLNESRIIQQIPFWWTWDDHDSFEWGNVEQWKKDNCRHALMNHTALDTYGENGQGIFTRFRRGPVEVFVLDTRWWHRTKPSFADRNKESLLGIPQFEWLKRELKASTAPVKLLCCGVIWYKKGVNQVGFTEGDSWLDYPHEREALFEFIGDQKIPGVLLIGGDIHASSFCRFKTAKQTGYDMRSFTTSPLHDGARAVHNYKDRDYIEWGAVVPNVFLRITVDSTVTPATITGSWIQMSGNTAHEVKMTVDDLKP